eukprot:TRINITY_DN1770_c0_g1_i1.p1 TRINITY_DN1770_c0_g1~~TRINITY_DN1770_c0_g1_i1.p1  ORF type:complete len:268 (-),score=59.25 TRINITY_DN1770_c0_g1_i1:156-959(-)
MSKAKVVIVFYSLYTHTYQLAKAIQEGAESVGGVEVSLYQVPETLSKETIEKYCAGVAKQAMKDVPILTHDLQGEVFRNADAVIFGSPTRFGSMTAQMKHFFDGLGGLWYENIFVGKIGSAFTGSQTQHGGQETTIFTIATCMFHLGMVVVGLPYSCSALKESKVISGGSPYGATFVSPQGTQTISENERECGKFQGRHVAILAKQLKAGSSAVASDFASLNDAGKKKTDTVTKPDDSKKTKKVKKGSTKKEEAPKKKDKEGKKKGK